MKAAICKATHHKVNQYRVMRTPNLVSVGCQRCGKQVDLVRDNWTPGNSWLGSILWLIVPAVLVTLMAVSLGWTS